MPTLAHFVEFVTEISIFFSFVHYMFFTLSILSLYLLVFCRWFLDVAIFYFL